MKRMTLKAEGQAPFVPGQIAHDDGGRFYVALEFSKWPFCYGPISFPGEVKELGNTKAFLRNQFKKRSRGEVEVQAHQEEPTGVYPTEAE